MTVARDRRINRRKERLDRGIKVRSDGLFAISSWREITYLVLPRLILILGLLSIPLVLDDYWQRVMCQAGVFALLALIFDFLAEYVGLVCLGGSFFVGVGGYFSGFLSYYLGLPPALSILVGSIVGGFFSTFIFLSCLRLKRIYFAIVSFMFPMLSVHIIIALNIFGGTEGKSALQTFPNNWVDQYLILVAVLILLFSMRRLVNSDIGLVFRGIKDNDQTVEASGISIFQYKALAVLIISLIGCFCGAYFCHLYGGVGLSFFAMNFTILPIAASVMGGMGTLVGPVLGAFILTPLSEALREFGQLRVVVYCFILIGFIVFNPEGIMSYITRKYEKFEHWKEV